MQPFNLTLSNNGTVAGVHSIAQSASQNDHRPLIVALHGGCYDHQYFDATPKYSASNASEAFGVPFVAIDRPSYGGTSCILPIPEDSEFYQETGRWLHSYILPKLWAEYGIPNHCTCIVLLAHSLGVMGAIVAAALHAQDPHLYPLGGLIANGMGNTQSSFMRDSPPSAILVGDHHTSFPTDKKDAVMFKPGTVDPVVLMNCERLNAVSPLADVAQYPALWLPVWKESWAPRVKTSVLFCLVEDDPFFAVNEQEIEICKRAFSNSDRVDASLVRDAPHCMELSYWSQGWYARSFGFALECSAGFYSSVQSTCSV